MPYDIMKSKKKGDPRPWKIVKKDTGAVVGSSKTRKDAIGSIAHRTDYENKQSRLAKPITNKNSRNNKGRKKTNSV